MTDNELKEIRQKISCPQLGDKHYGEWGILTKNQRFTIKRMLDYIESQEEYINRLQAENGIYETCNARKDEAIKHLENEIKRLQAENERVNKTLVFEINSAFERGKAEAYKEVWGKLRGMCDAPNWCVCLSEIDNYFEELVVKNDIGRYDHYTDTLAKEYEVIRNDR